MKMLEPKIFVKRILSDLKMGELEQPEISKIKDFLESAGYERTLHRNTKLSVVYELWLSEKAKQKKSSKSVRKAENVLGAATQTYWEMMRRKGGYVQESRKKRKFGLAAPHQKPNPLESLKNNLKKLGITADEKIEEILDSLKKTKSLKCEIDAVEQLDRRVDAVLKAFKGRLGDARGIFSENHLLLALPDKQFEKLLEKKKEPM